MTEKDLSHIKLPSYTFDGVITDKLQLNLPNQTFDEEIEPMSKRKTS